jgi:hypothetical protein
MMRDSSDWESFWDLASPEKGAATIMELYGAAAGDAAADCAAAALADDRDADYRFWTAVLGRVRAAELRAAAGQSQEPGSPQNGYMAS